MLKGIPKPRTLGPAAIRPGGTNCHSAAQGCGGGAAILGGPPLSTTGPLASFHLERSSVPGSQARLPSARPNVTPGSLPARTQHLGKVPTDASAFLPAQVGGGAPPAARPLGAGIAAARALPRAHPHERPRGTAHQVRATPRGMRSRPLARAARPPARRQPRSGPARETRVRSSRSRPGGQPSTPAPRLTCTRVVAAAGILSTRRAPRRGKNRGRAACGLCTRSRSPVRVPGSRDEQPARTGPPCSRPAGSPPPLLRPPPSWREGF